MSVRSIASILALGAIALLASGCATKGPPYQASIPNVEVLRKAEIKPMQVGGFTAKPDLVGATSIGIRADSMVSPVGTGFADYLAAALKQELELARLLDPKSSIQVSGVLLKNDISAAGVVTNSGEIEARFMVMRGDQLRYDQVKRATLEWESSFFGPVAIPRAQQQYPVMVQKLLGELFADAAFIAACK